MSSQLSTCKARTVAPNEFLSNFLNFLYQKTREGCGCFWDLLGGSRGKLQGKLLEKCLESQNALNSRISGTGKGKPAGNLGSTLLGDGPTFCEVFFLKSTFLTFSSFLHVLHRVTSIKFPAIL